MYKKHFNQQLKTQLSADLNFGEKSCKHLYRQLFLLHRTKPAYKSRALP